VVKYNFERQRGLDRGVRMNKKADTENIIGKLVWIAVFVILAIGVYFLLKTLTGVF